MLNLVPSHLICTASVSKYAFVLAFVDKDSAEAIFYHVPNDPIRREKLSSRRDAFLRDLHIFLEKSKSIILEFGVVILIEPADDLHLIRPIFFGDVRDHVAENTILLQDVVGQQKLGIAAHLLKHTRQ